MTIKSYLLVKHMKILMLLLNSILITYYTHYKYYFNIKYRTKLIEF
jgi:hypothetical protein